MDHRFKKKELIALPLLIALCGLVLYSHTLSYDFVYDDLWTIVYNDALNHITPVARFFSDSSTSAYPPSGISGDVYRPLPTLSLALNKSVGGMNPSAFRLWNLLLHLLNAELLYFFLKRRLNPMAAFFGGLFFLVHPAQVESVVWITQRSNLLCGLGILVALMGSRSPVWMILGFLMALFSKETALGWPLILLAVGQLSSDKRLALKNTLKAWAPLLSSFGVAVLYLLMRRQALGRWGQAIEYQSTVLSSLTDGMTALSKYVQILLWPLHLNVSIRPPEPSLATYFGSAVGVLFLLGWTVAIYKSRNKSWPLFLGLLCSFVFWIPHSGILPLVTYASERFLYLPLLGLSMLVAWGAQKKRGMLYISIALVFFSLLTFRRTFDWKTEKSLWAASLKENPQNYFALGCYAFQLDREGNYSEAQKYYESALANRPTVTYAKVLITQLIRINEKLGNASQVDYWKKKLPMEKDPT